jgi:hypothetical protein
MLITIVINQKTAKEREFFNVWCEVVGDWIPGFC